MGDLVWERMVEKQYWPGEDKPRIYVGKEVMAEEEKSRYKEVYIPTYSAQKFMPMTGCTDCGALVADKEAHDRHHE